MAAAALVAVGLWPGSAHFVGHHEEMAHVRLSQSHEHRAFHVLREIFHLRLDDDIIRDIVRLFLQDAQPRDLSTLLGP